MFFEDKNFKKLYLLMNKKYQYLTFSIQLEVTC